MEIATKLIKMTITIPNNYKDIYVIGDIHGEFKELAWTLIEKYHISDSVVVIAGDCGFGFEKPGYYEDLYFGKLEKRLKSKNILILCLRGNHDDPDYFNGERRIDWEFLKCIPDYSEIHFKDKSFLCIGGAVSVDQDWRITENSIQKRMGSSKRVWWENEIPIELGDSAIQRLPGHIYSVITHECPISFLPVLARGIGGVNTEDIFESVLESREYLEKILWRTKPTRWYYGHHHKTYSGDTGTTKWRGLGIMELIRVPTEEDD